MATEHFGDIVSRTDLHTRRRHGNAPLFPTAIIRLCGDRTVFGPPIKNRSLPPDAKRITHELRDLYREALAEIRIVTRPNSKVIFITPRFKDSERKSHGVDAESLIRLAGFRPVETLKHIRLPERLGASPDEIRRANLGVLRYARSDQKVMREIHVLKT